MGAQKLYVGNLSFDATKDDVGELYSKYGTVRDVYFPLNQQTGAPRGFAFVTLDEENAEKAIEETNGLEFLGRPLVVSLPIPPGEKSARKERPSESSPVSSDWPKVDDGLLRACTVTLTLTLLRCNFSPTKALHRQPFLLHRARYSS